MAKASKPAPDAEVKKSKPAPDAELADRPFYEEWECKITLKKEGDKTVPEYEKLKMKRGRVLISDEQAEILNEGVLYGGNNYASMYFKPE